MPIAVASNTIVLMTWPLSVSSTRLTELFHGLSAHEKDRASRFRSAPAAQQFVLSHGVARELLAQACGCRPSDLEFEIGANGKPRIGSPAGAPSFNLSHCRDLAALAITPERPIGVDVEAIGAFDEELAVSCLTSREATGIAAMDAKAKAGALYRTWVLKEAYLKATGDGLAGGLMSLETSICHEAAIRPVSLRGCAASIRGWQFFPFSVSPIHVGAIAVETQLTTRELVAHMIDPETAIAMASRAADFEVRRLDQVTEARSQRPRVKRRASMATPTAVFYAFFAEQFVLLANFDYSEPSPWNCYIFSGKVNDAFSNIHYTLRL